MEYNEDLEQFTLEYDGILFVWDKEPKGNYMEQQPADGKVWPRPAPKKYYNMDKRIARYSK